MAFVYSIIFCASFSFHVPDAASMITYWTLLPRLSPAATVREGHKENTDSDNDCASAARTPTTRLVTTMSISNYDIA